MWKSIKKISANLCTTGESFRRVILLGKGVHSHEPETINRIERQIMSAVCKRKASENISERTRKIVKL